MAITESPSTFVGEALLGSILTAGTPRLAQALVRDIEVSMNSLESVSYMHCLGGTCWDHHMSRCFVIYEMLSGMQPTRLTRCLSFC